MELYNHPTTLTKFNYDYITISNQYKRSEEEELIPMFRSEIERAMKCLKTGK